MYASGANPRRRVRQASVPNANCPQDGLRNSPQCESYDRTHYLELPLGKLSRRLDRVAARNTT